MLQLVWQKLWVTPQITNIPILWFMNHKSNLTALTAAVKPYLCIIVVFQLHQHLDHIFCICLTLRFPKTRNQNPWLVKNMCAISLWVSSTSCNAELEVTLKRPENMPVRRQHFTVPCSANNQAFTSTLTNPLQTVACFILRKLGEKVSSIPHFSEPHNHSGWYFS